MDWQLSSEAEDIEMLPSEEAVKPLQGFTVGEKHLINWFTWFPSRLLRTLASITFFMCVCEAFSGSGLFSRPAAFQIHWHQMRAVVATNTRTHTHTGMHTHASSSNQWSLNRLSHSLVVMTPKQVDFQLNHTQLWLFLFWFGICSVRVRDGSLSSSTRGRWCSWGSLINSSRAFISSLMDLVSAYQGFDYLP